MSRAYQVFGSIAGAPGLVDVSSIGLQDLNSTLNSDAPNGIILNDLSIVGCNHNAVGTGSTLFAMQLGFWDGATVNADSPFYFHNFNFRIATSVAGFMPDTYSFQRSFPAGIISPAGMTHICVNCSAFTNLIAWTFTLDLSYTPY